MGTAYQEVIASNEDLLALIPQRPPMVMIDALLRAEEKEYETAFTIREDNIFVENQILLESGLIENIAQTTAAGVGQRYKSDHKPIPIGFIGAVQNLSVFHLPNVGDQLKTVVSLSHKVMNISVVNGKVFNQGQIAAQCDMKLFLQE